MSIIIIMEVICIVCVCEVPTRAVLYSALTYSVWKFRSCVMMSGSEVT